MERGPAATGNLAYRLAPWAELEPDRIALIDLASGERVFTYAAFDGRIDRVAGLVRDAGVAPGERMLVAIGNRAEFLEAVFGAMRAGAVPVPLDTRSAAARLAHRIADAEPTGVILEPAAAPAVPGLLRGRPLRLCLALGEPLPNFDSFEPAREAARPLGEPVVLSRARSAFSPTLLGLDRSAERRPLDARRPDLVA